LDQLGRLALMNQYLQELPAPRWVLGTLGVQMDQCFQADRLDRWVLQPPEILLTLTGLVSPPDQRTRCLQGHRSCQMDPRVQRHP